MSNNSEINLADNPKKSAKQLIVNAYQMRGKNYRAALRVMNRVLKLAKERGYQDKDNLIDFFSLPDADKEKPTQGKRYLSHLFEFVSADEVVQLAQMRG